MVEQFVKIISHYPNRRTCSLLIKSKMCQHTLIDHCYCYAPEIPWSINHISGCKDACSFGLIASNTTHLAMHYIVSGNEVTSI